MGKIIIENRSSKSDLTAMNAVQHVMASGRVSNNGKQYCYFTTFNYGISVASFLNSKSDRFVVSNHQTAGEEL